MIAIITRQTSYKWIRYLVNHDGMSITIFVYILFIFYNTIYDYKKTSAGS